MGRGGRRPGELPSDIVGWNQGGECADGKIRAISTKMGEMLHSNENKRQQR